MHVGHRLGLCPPKWAMAQGGIYHPTDGQLGLLECWQKVASEWSGPDIMVVVGDAIDGQGSKTKGTEQWTTDLYDQLMAASELIRMWRPKRIYLINGTGYHVDAGGRPLEALLGDILGAEIIGPNRMRSAEELFLRAGGKTFHFSHHIMVGTGWYKTTALAREMVFALLNESHKHRVDVVVRAHVHYHVTVGFTRQLGVILPCWQLQTRYMLRRSAFGMLPDIGAIRFIIDEDIKIEKRIFKPEQARPPIVVC